MRDERLALIVLALALLISPPTMAASKPPNVVIFVADDLGWADVGFHGEESIETPSLDRLSLDGMELPRFYTTPICSPTRAALMTGRDPMRLGVAYGVILPWSGSPLRPITAKDSAITPPAPRPAIRRTTISPS